MFKSNKLIKTPKSKKMCKSFTRTTIYVARLLRKVDDDGIILGKSMPCIDCQRFLSTYNVNKIKYTDNIDGVNVLCELRKKII